MYKTANVEGREDSSFPADGHQAVLNKTYKKSQRQPESGRTTTIRINEQGHDKTNKMSVRPAKTQISLGIRPV